jgi:hypothetical protein
MRKIGIGCGGLLAVLVLLIVLGALIGGKPAQDAAQKGFEEGFKNAQGDPPSSSAEPTQPKAKSGSGTATVRITGTPGISFSGNYGSTSAGNRTVDGAVPQDFQAQYKNGFGQFDVVTAFFQKQTDDPSELTVQIVVDGEVKKEQTTTAAYGVADVSWSTTE